MSYMMEQHHILCLLFVHDLTFLWSVKWVFKINRTVNVKS